MARKSSVTVGYRSGRIVTVEVVSRDSKGNAYWLCKCDCGETTTVSQCSIKSGDTRSCGCYREETSGKSNWKHGKTKTRTYSVWSDMKARCAGKTEQCRKDYAARGITVCDRWLDSFENFLADMGEQPDGMMLERKDNDKGYDPDNCTWATRKEQNRNRRSVRYLTHNGVTKKLCEWADEYKISSMKLRSRIDSGWEVGRALTTR